MVKILFNNNFTKKVEYHINDSGLPYIRITLILEEEVLVHLLLMFSILFPHRYLGRWPHGILLRFYSFEVLAVAFTSSWTLQCLKLTLFIAAILIWPFQFLFGELNRLGKLNTVATTTFSPGYFVYVWWQVII